MIRTVRNRMPILIAATILLILNAFIDSICVKLYAEELPQGINASIEPGAGGLLHLGRINPITVYVENNGDSQVFECEAGVLCGSNTYSRELKAAAGDTVSTVMYVDLDPPPPLVAVWIKSKSGKLLLNKVLDLSDAADPNDAMILVVDDQPGGLSYLDGVPILNGNRGMMNTDGDDFAAGRMRFAYAPLALIRETGMRYLSPADVVVLHAGDFSKLSDSDIEGIQAFVARGGILVTSMGADAPKLAMSSLGGLLPYDVAVAEPTSDLSGLSAVSATASPAGVTAITGSGTLKKLDGIEVLAANASYPLVIARDYGFGKIVQFNFDYSQPSLRNWQGWTGFWRRLLTPLLTAPKLEDDLLDPGSVFDILGDFPQANPVPLRLSGLFILIYVLLVGPVNYALLARKKKRTLLWITIPVVVIAFSCFAVLLGYISRGTQNIVRSVDQIHFFPDVPVGVGRKQLVYFSSASRRDSVTLKMDGGEIRTGNPPSPTSRNYWSYAGPNQPKETQQATIAYTPETALERRMNKWTPYDFWADGYMVNGEVSANWSDDKKVTINYKLPSQALDSWLDNGGLLNRTGALEPEGVLDSTIEKLNANPGNGAGKSLARRRYDLIDIRNDFGSALPAYFGTKLVTFSFGSRLDCDFSNRYSKDEATLMVFHLPGFDGRSGRTKVTVEDFITTSARATAQQPNPYYGNSGKKGIVTLYDGDTIVFRLEEGYVIPQASYKLSASFEQKYYWNTQSQMKYDITVEGVGYRDFQTDISSETAEFMVPGDVVQKGGIKVTILSHTGATITSVSLLAKR